MTVYPTQISRIKWIHIFLKALLTNSKENNFTYFQRLLYPTEHSIIKMISHFFFFLVVRFVIPKLNTSSQKPVAVSCEESFPSSCHSTQDSHCWPTSWRLTFREGCSSSIRGCGRAWVWVGPSIPPGWLCFPSGRPTTVTCEWNCADYHNSRTHLFSPFSCNKSYMYKTIFII